jgi:hypothetical protein
MKLFAAIATVLFIISCKSFNHDDQLFLSTSGRTYSKKELLRLKDPNLSIDSLIQRHIQAIGGLDAIRATRMLHEKHILIKHGDTTITDSWFELGKKSRSFVKRKDVFITCYGTQSSGFATIREDAFPDELTVGEYVTNDEHYFANLFGANYYGIPGLLIDYASKGIKVNRVDGPELEVYELEVVMPDKRLFHLFFDPTTFMVKSGTVTWTDLPPGEKGFVMDYRDFTVTKEGYQYPLSQYWAGWEAPGKCSDSSIRGWNILTEYNPSIPDTLFKVDRVSLYKYEKQYEDHGFPIETYETSHNFGHSYNH